MRHDIDKLEGGSGGDITEIIDIEEFLLYPLSVQNDISKSGNIIKVDLEGNFPHNIPNNSDLLIGTLPEQYRPQNASHGFVFSWSGQTVLISVIKPDGKIIVSNYSGKTVSANDYMVFTCTFLK